jgi:hypothetical protein
MLFSMIFIQIEELQTCHHKANRLFDEIKELKLQLKHMQKMDGS